MIKIILLWPFSLIYGLVMELRAAAYKIGLFRSHKASVPVISIGNIVAGGTGKTPMAIYVARILIDSGLRTAVLSRGYKRRTKGRNQKANTQLVSDGLSVLCSVDEAGDEPFLMATRLLGTKEKPGAMVIVGRDRAAGAAKAVALGAEVIILDDGFQHLRLKRDLDIVLLDGRRPFDSGWLLPAGLLREPKSALDRAGAIVLTRCDNQNPKSNIQNLKAVVFETRHQPGRPYNLSDARPPDLEQLKKSRILLFSGIARPESFEQSVGQAGLTYLSHLRYPDHHLYSRGQLERIAQKSRGCDFLMTTEKDAVRLPPRTGFGKPLLVLPVEIEFTDEGQQLEFDKLVLDKVGKK